jgi:hypothetical protein
VVEEVEEEGWLSRIGGAIKGVLIGLVLFGIAFPLLWWNEGRAVDTALTIDTVEKEAVTVPADSVDASKDGKLVHLNGQAATTETLTDKECGVTVANGIRLERKVEMYQWEEDKDTKKKKNLGGSTTKTTTYTYEKVWSARKHDSSNFKEKEGHQNPASWPIEASEWEAKEVKLGAHLLTSNLVGQIDADQTLKPGAVPAAVGGKAAKLAGDQLYIGKDPNAPEIGDVRITFKAATPQPVTVVAQQAGASFAAWTSPTKQAVEWLYPGTLTIAGVCEQKRTANTIITWVLRGVGFLLMVVGLSMIFKPLEVVADVIPFLGDLVGMGFFLVALGMSFVFSMLTIALAWVAHRPLVGIPMLIAAVAVFGALIMKARARKAGAAPAAPAT